MSWRVSRIIAKDGTLFNAWRVQDPSGRTVWVTTHQDRAETFALFAPIITAEFGVQDQLAPTGQQPEPVPAVGSRLLDCAVCGRHFPDYIEHACTGPRSRS